MSKKGFRVYLLLTEEQFEVRFSFDPEFELRYLVKEKGLSDFKAYSLTQPLPIALASYLQQFLELQGPQSKSNSSQKDGYLQRLAGSLGLAESGPTESLSDYLQAARELLSYYSLAERVVLQEINLESSASVKLPSAAERARFYRLLQGRLLYYEEIKQAIEESHLELSSSLLALLQSLKLADKLEYRPSIAYQDRNYLVCQRCGQSAELVKMSCARCGLEDYYCNNCLYMGQSRLCRPLFAFVEAKQEQSQAIVTEVEPYLEFELTEAQAAASQALVEFVQGAKEEALVWAVCGAGKTEVSFGAIAEVLSQGGKVLFAIPRKDPVIELAPRLAESFPDFEVTVLHGTSTAKYQTAPLTIATTHQCLRFIDAFELVILDEMDAFPYQGSQMLELAVERACSPQGKIIYMTATPGNELLDFEYDLKKELIKIPARYHGHPVPEPELLVLGLNYEQETGEVELPKQVGELIESSIQERRAQLFVFVPTKELVKVVGERLREELPVVNGNSWVQYSHSQSPQREEIRESFSQGEYPILVSTTIMERGITVPKADVLVLFADWDFVFDAATLIQMAGRAGRSLEHPTGEVYFVGTEISREMKEAQCRIQSLNQEAREKGYI
ncbi:DEAD/DEAH box helicase [Fuchsiella alkaliacetigena]|uniref:DEAD/DEAH box helicase n=1 Tax=Fuchsiella alkaliacetigena TaxID=957042 RepID=UPI00200B6543|nr:helicase-related protein [Fuchsiella alkaliacetigena]MCK8824167.1 DEAD/DEAH box helicase family protein [Fuchsiella alkaliacetigena]